MEAETTNYTNSIKIKTKYKWKIAWSNAIILTVLHLFAIYGFFIKWRGKWQSIVFWKFLGFFASLGVTGGAHRLWAHKSYKANSIVQILLMLMMSITYQNSIYVWCRDHRVHHKFSETDADPHNAKRGFFFSHVGWLMIRKHPDVIKKGKTVDMSDLEENSIVMFQHKYYYEMVIIFGVMLPIIIPMYFWGETFVYSFFVVVIYRYIVSVNLTWCINSLAHLYGNKPYDKNIGPTENPMMRYLGYGEGFHNYHHTFPSDYKAAELGNDMRNITTLMIDLFAKFGWVTERKSVDASIVQKRMERTGDGTDNRDEVEWKNLKLSVPSREAANLKHFIYFIIYMGLL